MIAARKRRTNSSLDTSTAPHGFAERRRVAGSARGVRLSVVDDPDRFRLDDETVERGRRELARIRRRLDPLARTDVEDQPGDESTVPSDDHREVDDELVVVDPPEPDDSTGVGEESLSTERMAAEMAAGAHRELLERRVVELEGEVQRLRATLAAVQRALANSYDSSAVDDD